jgi:intraflagellar transport protein 172
MEYNFVPQKAERFYLESNCERDAITMYSNAGRWEDAHRIASSCMKADDVGTMYISQAEQLQADAKFKEAER